MAYVHLSGIMLTPVNAPASNVPIRFTSVITYGQVVKHSDAVYVCGEDGSYDIDLLYGSYTVEAKFDESYEFVGNTYIDINTPPEVSLNDLFGHLVIPTHPNLAEMREIQAEVEQDAQEASADAASAASSAESAQNSATVATSASNTAVDSATAAAQSANAASLASQSIQGDVAAVHTDAANAATSAGEAAASATEAAQTVSLILGVQINTGINANSAEQDANSASGDAQSAAASASAALTSQTAAAASADTALSAQQNASTSEFSAAASASAASQSEDNANSYAASANTSSISATQSAAAAAASATASGDNATITTQNAASCAANASSASGDAFTAATAAINAESSETNAAASAASASIDASQCSSDSTAAISAAASATASANAAEQYAQALSTGVVAKGPWDASTGYFPNIPNPSTIVESYRITTQGTLRFNGPSGQPPMSVVASDLIYWGPADSLWYRVRIEDAVTGAIILSELAPVDGSGSGLDADLLDGKQGYEYGRLATTNTWTNNNYFQYGATGIYYSQIKNAPSAVTNNNQISNGSGFITGINKNMVVSALGYTPYQESTALSATTGSFSSSITGASLTVSGSVGASGNITAYSDYRIKTNLQVIPDALDKVTTLTGYTFDRTDVEMPRQVGLLARSEEHTSELQSPVHLVCRLLLEKKKQGKGEG